MRATRACYDAVATDYAGRFRGELAAKPLDPAMLAGFPELGGTWPPASLDFHRLHPHDVARLLNQAGLLRGPGAPRAG